MERAGPCRSSCQLCDLRPLLAPSFSSAHNGCSLRLGGLWPGQGQVLVPVALCGGGGGAGLAGKEVGAALCPTPAPPQPSPSLPGKLPVLFLLHLSSCCYIGPQSSTLGVWDTCGFPWEEDTAELSRSILQTSGCELLPSTPRLRGPAGLSGLSWARQLSQEGLSRFCFMGTCWPCRREGTLSALSTVPFGLVACRAGSTAG